MTYTTVMRLGKKWVGGETPTSEAASVAGNQSSRFRQQRATFRRRAASDAGSTPSADPPERHEMSLVSDDLLKDGAMGTEEPERK